MHLMVIQGHSRSSILRWLESRQTTSRRRNLPLMLSNVSQIYSKMQVVWVHWLCSRVYVEPWCQWSVRQRAFGVLCVSIIIYALQPIQLLLQ